MTCAPQVHHSAPNILAFHDSHHDLIKGTLAPDLHGNLPRHLRSVILQTNRAPFRLPATGAPRSSPYRTPQWTELSECIREVSPPPFPDEDVRRLAGSRAEPLSHSPSTTMSLPGYAVVRRLADLSQASDVDPAAITAALREAERVLEVPMDAGTNREYARCSGAMIAERSTDEERLPLSRGRATSSVASSASARLREEDAQSRCPRHHHEHPRHQRHHCDGSRALSPEHVTAASGLGAASCFHSSSPWGWPAPAPVLSGSPAPPRPAPTATNSPANNHAGPHASSSTAGVLDPTLRWYDVYYAWMFYYQQLYAAQALQERQRQRAKRGKREKRESHRTPHGRHAVSRAASSGPEASMGNQEDGTHYAHVLRQPRAVARVERGGGPEGAVRSMSEASVSMSAQPIRHHCPISPPKPSTHTRASQTPRVPGEKNAKGDDRAARLRAELRRLEEEYATLSSSLADVEGDEAQPPTCADGRIRQFAAASAAGATIARPQPAFPPAPAEARAQRGKWLDSRDDVGPTSHRGSAAPAETWQALSERQRNETFHSMARVRASRGPSPQPLSRQRPQWRH
ncbi:conserved hypothetical protein [Leishmania infantum JPCM5]|uniref:Uncharacterized protein n=2 Tax=Leishmania infantum TaxID=5671 RepID=A4IA45_LEIIN|nr:conserved hypothetical protein [Leishmania infantum JPCM5]CAC9539515.1 hypothetical_protein_-_conserved [Leishmania infantum]CAM71701.1 conserved hypothetical protein [Leishmania infantum JPCM5]SUZ45636.1 hypothetical_protein_-_conserved [Leishmania infantum]|eukprot:XP_001468614.1 conserved hypothetical protein [Leishmania infantum JPCM5]